MSSVNEVGFDGEIWLFLSMYIYIYSIINHPRNGAVQKQESALNHTISDPTNHSPTFKLFGDPGRR